MVETICCGKALTNGTILGSKPRGPPISNVKECMLLFLDNIKITRPAQHNTTPRPNNMHSSVNSVVEFPGAGLGRLITINSELNGAI